MSPSGRTDHQNAFAGSEVLAQVGIERRKLELGELAPVQHGHPGKPDIKPFDVGVGAHRRPWDPGWVEIPLSKGVGCQPRASTDRPP